MKTCPQCAESIREEALKCRYCGSEQPNASEEKVIASERPALRSYCKWLILGFVLMIAFGLGLLVFLLIALDRMGKSYVVTNRRLMVQRGLVSKDTDEVNLAHIRNIKTKQNPLERILRFGDIYVGTAGTAGYEVIIRGVKNPKKFKKIISRAKK